MILFKSGIGSALAILIADRLNLLYSASAGIITLLTIQKTRKETLVIAFKRIAAFFLAVSIAYLIFTYLAFTTFAFGAFIFIFVALAKLLNIEVGVVMNAVLVSHFLVEQRIDLPLIINEGLILLIGMSIGILVNLIMPNNKEKIMAEQKVVEERIKENLYCLAELLATGENTEQIHHQKETIDLLKIDDLIDDLLVKAYQDAGNTLLNETKYQISYLEMRKKQLAILKDILESMEEIKGVFPEALRISNYMKRMSGEFTERNNVKKLLMELDALYVFFSKEALPTSRNEFENRAILFHLLKDLKKFLETKRMFVEED